ncbi:hypothetical protein [Actinophytocola sediminis]
MIDVLRVLVDALGRLVPAARDQPTAARLGYDLLVSYATLNRSLMCAGDVVTRAEIVAGRARDEVWVVGKGPGGELSELEYLLKAQLRNLNKVEAMLIGRYREQLDLVGGELAELRVRLGERNTVLRVLLGRLGWNQLPLEGLPLLDDEPLSSATPEILDLNRNRAAIAAGMTAYLALWRPRERVDEITESMAALRAALLCGFAVDDLLPLVGDARFR